MANKYELDDKGKLNILKKTILEFTPGGKGYHNVKGSDDFKEGWNYAMEHMLHSIDMLQNMKIDINVSFDGLKTSGGESDEPGTD